MNPLDFPAVWGLAGAFVYAAPKFSACFFEARRGDGQWGRCAIDSMIALMTGAIAAAAFGVWAQTWLERTGEQELRALATLIGLLANPCAPGVVDIGQKVVAWFGEIMSKRIKGNGS